MRSTIRPTMVVPVPHACVLVLLSRCLSVSAAFPVPSVARVLREKKVVISFSYLKHKKKRLRYRAPAVVFILLLFPKIDTIMEELNSYRDEVFVAQCLVSMSKEEPRGASTTPPTVGQRCDDERTSVSEGDEEYNPIEDIIDDERVIIPIRYSRDNMITTFALPDPRDWERRDRHSSSSSNEW